MKEAKMRINNLELKGSKVDAVIGAGLIVIFVGLGTIAYEAVNVTKKVVNKIKK